MLSAIDIPNRDQIKINAIEQQFKQEIGPYLSSPKLESFQDTIKIGEDTISIKNSDELIQENRVEGYFGYNFFQDIPEMLIWENQPPHSGYVLGPGDEILIEVWGGTQISSKKYIDQYGKINIDNIGQIFLTGLTLDEVESKLLNKFKNVYSSLKGDNPTATLDVSIGKLKSINVSFLGEVSIPGIHAIHPFSTIITGLIQKGGINITGSLRDIQIIRNGQVMVSLDFYQYIINGDAYKDLRLLDGDVLFVPVRHSTITINGAIVRESKYELLPGETILDLINYSGGIRSDAHKKISIHRLKTMQEYSPFEPTDNTFYIDYLTNKDFVLQNGDDILVYNIPTSLHEVYIEGQVKNPGTYSFSTSNEVRILDILDLAGGLNDTSYIKTIYLDKGYIVRRNPESIYPDIIEFNIQKLLTKDPIENLILQNWDKIFIRKSTNFHEPETIIITGEVMLEGVYTLQKQNETMNDIIQRAGGFNKNAFVDGIKLFRDDILVAKESNNIVLMNRDSIFVPKHTGVVKVIGAVYKPGYVQYNKNYGLKDYINQGGGPTYEADINNITIVNPNGDIQVRKWRFFSPKIIEGSTIIVQYEEQKTEYNLMEYTTNIASLVSSMATIYLLIKNN